MRVSKYRLNNKKINMVWYEYKYTPSSEIIENTKKLLDFNLLESAILIWLIIFIIILIYYIIPIINIFFEKKEKERIKQDRKKLLAQISLQKEINEEIEKELEMH